MNAITGASLVNWPNTTITDNFEFSTIDKDGSFNFLFKWMNNRWNCWVTLPDNSVREAGVYPNIINWVSALDFGLVFKTDLAEISHDSLFMTELYIVKW